MRYSKIEGNINLIKDQLTGAVLNTNNSEYRNYLALKNQKEKNNLKLNDLEKDLNSLKNDIFEIKDLLRRILNESRWYFFKWY